MAGAVELSGRTALLTGASGGIGEAIAETLHALGVEVLLSARRREVLEQLATRLGKGARVLPADLDDRDDVARLVEAAGEVDVLVANAALPGSGRLDEFTPEQIDRTLEVNLRAPVLLARELMTGMETRGSGHLVFISSLSGKVATAGSSLYSATKFGLRGFAAGLREDLHGTGVGVTTVFPGFVSDAGLFAESGVELPRFVSTVTPQQVADGVVRGIERNRGEVDVAPLGLRLGTRLSALAPRSTEAIQRRLGSKDLADQIARGQADKR